MICLTVWRSLGSQIFTDGCRNLIDVEEGSTRFLGKLTDIHLDESRGRVDSLIWRSRPEVNPPDPTARSSLSWTPLPMLVRMEESTPKPLARACAYHCQFIIPTNKEQPKPT